MKGLGRGYVAGASVSHACTIKAQQISEDMIVETCTHYTRSCIPKLKQLFENLLHLDMLGVQKNTGLALHETAIFISNDIDMQGRGH